MDQRGLRDHDNDSFAGRIYISRCHPPSCSHTVYFKYLKKLIHLIFLMGIPKKVFEKYNLEVTLNTDKREWHCTKRTAKSKQTSK